MKTIISWLLEGDPSIIYQVNRDLLASDQGELDRLQHKILTDGWGKKLLSEQNASGHWGEKFYFPKWTCSHYTLLDLKNLCVPVTPGIKKCIQLILKENFAIDGGLNPNTQTVSDVCINGMFLNYACTYETDGEVLKSIVDYIISNHMKDGGFNCRLNRGGAVHSSVHTTICTLEGIASYINNGYTYKLSTLIKIKESAEEFLLAHHLYKSDKTGKIIHPHMLVMAYPSRYKYSFIRALDYFQSVDHVYDPRMADALEVLLDKKNKRDRWSMQSKIAGQQHFVLERGGSDSRINTLIALRILKKYGHNLNESFYDYFNGILHDC